METEILALTPSSLVSIFQDKIKEMLILRRHSEEHPNSIEDEDDVHVKSDLLLLDNPGDAVARAKQRSKASKKKDKSKASKTKRSEGKV